MIFVTVKKKKVKCCCEKISPPVTVTVTVVVLMFDHVQGTWKHPAGAGHDNRRAASYYTLTSTKRGFGGMVCVLVCVCVYVCMHACM